MPSQKDHFDLAVMGGGSSGIAAALAAAQAGLRVIVVERGAMPGGTATRGGVNCWEPGVGGTGIPFDIYRRIKRDHPEAIGIYTFGRQFWRQQEGFFWPDQPDKVIFPGGEALIDLQRRYHDTLRRHPDPGLAGDQLWNWKLEHLHGVPFLPDPMAAAIDAMLRETGRAELRLNTGFAELHAAQGRVHGADLTDGSRISASCWVDGTGGIFCHALGCETLRGFDPRSRFNEPGAPEQAADLVNAVTLMYRIEPTDTECVEPLPDGVPAACWWASHFPVMSCVQYPDLSRNCNMLPTMEGTERIRLGYRAAYEECVRRVKAHWHFVQTHWPEFRCFHLSWIPPMLGIRESRRVVCEKMLTANDIRMGLSRQPDEDIVTIADHSLDRHGSGGGCPELDEPYGVPYRCLIPKGWRNLLVAGRAAGFSSLAASSCRLTRTMMQLGQAAGTAAAIAVEAHIDLPDVSSDLLRKRLRDQHVQLEWPTPPELKEYLAHE